MKTKAWASTLLAAAMLFGAANASAAFITGSITMSGDFVPTGGATLGTATGIDFIADDFGVDDTTGDFAGAGIGAGDVGFFQDFQFNPLNPSPVDPLWAIGGFEFTLEAITIDFQNDFFLALSGTGTLSALGFDDTAGTWSLTANSAGALFNFSSGSTATGIAEPASLLLVGLGLIGFAASRRRGAK